MMAWLPPAPLKLPRALLGGQRCCLSETLAFPGLLRAGTCRAHHLDGLHGASGGLWLGPQTLGMGTFPPFPEAQQMTEHFVAHSKTLFVGLGMDKTQAIVSHQPPLLVCRLIHPRALPHDSSHSPRRFLLQRAGTLDHHQICSPQSKPCFCHPVIRLFQPHHLIPVWTWHLPL